MTRSSLKAEPHEGTDPAYDDESSSNVDDDDDDESYIDDDDDEPSCDDKYDKQDGETPVNIIGVGVQVHGRSTVHVSSDFISSDLRFWTSNNHGDVKYDVDCSNPLQASTGLCVEIARTEREKDGDSECSECTGGVFDVTIDGSTKRVELVCDGGAKNFCVKMPSGGCYQSSYEESNTKGSNSTNATGSTTTPPPLRRRRRLLQFGHSNC